MGTSKSYKHTVVQQNIDLESIPFKQGCCQYDFLRLVDSRKDAAQQEAALNASRQGWNIPRRAHSPSSFLPPTGFGQDGSAGSWQIGTTLAARDAVTKPTWLTAALIQKLQCAAITGLKAESILSDYGCLGWNALAFLCNILKKKGGMARGFIIYLQSLTVWSRNSLQLRWLPLDIKIKWDTQAENVKQHNTNRLLTNSNAAKCGGDAFTTVMVHNRCFCLFRCLWLLMLLNLKFHIFFQILLYSALHD